MPTGGLTGEHQPPRHNHLLLGASPTNHDNLDGPITSLTSSNFVWQFMKSYYTRGSHIRASIEHLPLTNNNIDPPPGHTPNVMHHCATASSKAPYDAVTATAQVGAPTAPTLPNRLNFDTLAIKETTSHHWDDVVTGFANVRAQGCDGPPLHPKSPPAALDHQT